MRKSRLALFVTTVLSAAPLVLLGPSASADAPACLRTITIDDPRVYEGTPFRTNDPTPLTYRLTTTGCVARAASVETHVIGQYQNHSDYVGVSEILAWPAGNGDAKTVTVNVIKDAVAENNERVYVGLCYDTTQVQGYSGGLGTIINDDDGDPAQEVPVGGEFVCK